MSLKISQKDHILKVFLISIVVFSIWLMVALLSFHPSDPSWLKTTLCESIHNLGGVTGAWFADTLLFIFGIIAYAIPAMIISSCWFSWRHRMNKRYIDYFSVSLHLIGTFMLVITSCVFVTIYLDNIWYFSPGGVIGNFFNTSFRSLLHSKRGTIVLLYIWIVGLKLFTGLSLIKILKKISCSALNTMDYIKNYYINHDNIRKIKRK